MATSLGNAAENAAGDHILGTTDWTFVAQLYLALFTANHDWETGTGGTEATGGGYVRKAIDFSACSGGASSNSGAITWTAGTDIATGTYTGWAVYDASSAGNFRFGDAFASSKVLDSAGATLTFDVGDVTFSLT